MSRKQYTPPLLLKTPMGRKRKPHPYGPHMTSLTTMQQKFVEALMNNPMAGNTSALRAAGYKESKNTKEDSIHRQAYRWSHDPVILEAMKEASIAKLAGMAPKAVYALDNIISDPKDRHHFRAIDGVLNRVGMSEIKSTETVHTVKLDASDLIVKIKAMAERLNIGLDPQKLLSPQVKVIDTEYVEVKDE